MKVAFVSRDPSAQYGIMALSSYVKAQGHDAQLMIAPLEKDLMGRLRAYDPGLLAFSVTTGRHVWALDMARKIKGATGLPVIMGGPHPTYFPQFAAEDVVDYVCVGEGEGALLDLMNALEKKQDPKVIPNLGYKKDGEVKVNPVRNLIDPLDSLPFVDREVYCQYPMVLDYQKDTCLVLSGRGCPYNCSFCYNACAKKIYRGKGTYLRKRSVEHVVNEARLLKEKYGVRRFIIDDDTLTYNEDWMDEFAERFSKEVGLHFICNARAENLGERMVKALKKAGCTGVKMGVETGDETLRKEVLNKPIANETLLAASARLHEAKIDLQTFNILGIPGGSLEKDVETLKFNQALKPMHAWCSVLNPYRGTAIRDTAIRMGLLEETTSEEFCRESYFVDTPLKIADKQKVLNLHHFFDLGVKMPFLLPLIRVAIAWPLTPLYELLFKLDHALSILRFYKIRLMTWLRFLWACRGVY